MILATDLQLCQLALVTEKKQKKKQVFSSQVKFRHSAKAVATAIILQSSSHNAASVV